MSWFKGFDIRHFIIYNQELTAFRHLIFYVQGLQLIYAIYFLFYFLKSQILHNHKIIHIFLKFTFRLWINSHTVRLQAL